MGIGYIPKKDVTGISITKPELPHGRLNLGGHIPPLSTLSSETIIDDGATWNAKFFALGCLQNKIKATIYWDYEGDKIILFHSDMPYTMMDNIEIVGNGVKKIRIEIKNLDPLSIQKATIVFKYDETTT